MQPLPTSIFSDAPGAGPAEPGERELEPITVTIKTGCRLTGLGPTKLYELIAAGAIQSVKFGGRRLLIYESLKRIRQPATPA